MDIIQQNVDFFKGKASMAGWWVCDAGMIQGIDDYFIRNPIISDKKLYGKTEKTIFITKQNITFIPMPDKIIIQDNDTMEIKEIEL